jgi:TonB family protein
MQAPARVAALILAATLAACATPWPSAPLPRANAPGTPPCGPQQYPFQALQDSRSGQVVVRAEVGPDGRVARAELERPSPHASLNAAALEGTRHCRFPASAAETQVRLLFSYEFWGMDTFLPRGVASVAFAPAP